MAVHLIRGCPEKIDTDRELTGELTGIAGETGEPALRVWIPPRQLAFGRRDSNEDGFPEAKAAANRRGFPPVERSVGGRAVAYDGETTVAFAYAVPVVNPRHGIDDRYGFAVERLEAALRATGAAVRQGEPPGSFCPGEHSLQVAQIDGPGKSDGSEEIQGGKIAGIAQRVTVDSALVSGVVLVRDSDELREVLAAVYGRLEATFDPDSVGSVAAAEGTPDPQNVIDEIESAFLAGRSATVHEELLSW